MNERKELDTKRLSRLFQLTTSIVALVLLVACAGGTKGTGGTGGSVFTGQVVSTSGMSISDALITLRETGDTTNSDASGRFLLESEVAGSEVTLLVESKGTEAAAVINEIPAADVSVDVKLELDEGKKTLTVREKKITPRPRPTKVPPKPTALVPSPEPTGTPDPGAPTLAPTPNPTPDGTVTPEPEPTSAPSPTVTPEPTASPDPTITAHASTRFIGVVVFENPALLPGSQINVAGRARRPIGPKGGFSFRVPASDANNTIVIATNGKFPRIGISGVTMSTTEVRLKLRVRQRANGTFRLFLDGLQVIGNTPLPTPSPTATPAPTEVAAP